MELVLVPQLSEVRHAGADGAQVGFLLEGDRHAADRFLEGGCIRGSLESPHDRLQACGYPREVGHRMTDSNVVEAMHLLPPSFLQQLRNLRNPRSGNREVEGSL